jgi:hypothetical protein
MRTSTPWHSAQFGTRVHHTNDRCEVGRSIQYYWIRHNTGGFPQCQTCAELDAADMVRAVVAPPPMSRPLGA